MSKSVWNDAHDWYALTWGNIAKAVREGSALNPGERMHLLMLLERVMASPEARRNLGFKVSRSRTAERNLDIAIEIAAHRRCGKSAAAADAAALKAHPDIKPATLKQITGSAKLMGRARAIDMAMYMSDPKNKPE